MKGVNKVILVGSLGADPQSKSFPNGGSVCNFSIATSEKWQDKNTGQWHEYTEWHRIVVKNRLGEIAQQYLKKVQKSTSKANFVHVPGRIKIIRNATQPKYKRIKCKCWIQHHKQMLIKGN